MHEPLFEDGTMADDNERCYEEVQIPAGADQFPEGKGVILNYDCGCSSLFLALFGR